MPPQSKATSNTPSLKDCKARDTASALPKTITIIGQTGSGKTTLAATACKDLADHLANPKEHVELDGLIWLSSDEQALAALTAKKLHPQYDLDVRKLLAQAHGDFCQAERWIFSLLAEAKADGATTLVHDTISSYGQFLVGYYIHGAACPESRSGNKDTMKGWGLVGERYRALYEEASALGLRQVILAHPKQNTIEDSASGGDATRGAQAKAVATSAPGENMVVPDVAGQSFRRYLQGAASLQMWLDVVDSKGKRERRLQTKNVPFVQTKSRYEHILEKYEPANLFLIDRKIEAAVQ